MSLASQSNLTNLEFRVSKHWFGSILNQLQTVRSERLTTILFWFWEEKAVALSRSDWKRLHEILSVKSFPCLINVSFLEIDEKQYRYPKDIEISEFLPRFYKTGALCYLLTDGEDYLM